MTRLAACVSGLVACAALVCTALGCSTDGPTGSGRSASGASGAAGAGVADEPGAGADLSSFNSDQRMATAPTMGARDDSEQTTGEQVEAACVQDNAEATLELRPIDIIITIDTSGSMGQEIDGVQSNINQNFAGIIEQSGIDYRVIVISDNDVCIMGSLNPSGCGQSTPPTFYWVDYGIGSDDTWCAIVDSYATWSYLLRPEAFKVFVAVTDDEPSCNSGGVNFNATQAGADAFDAALLALDAAQFGTAAERNYVFHSLVALADNTPATEAYQPSDPVVTGECATAASAGLGYQELSQTTEGLRFPVCEGNNFDAVFQTIAEGIVEGAAVACEFEIPAQSEDGKDIVRDTVEVAYIPGDRSATIKFDKVDAADCKTEAFVIEGDLVKLCPEACSAVKEDRAAEMQVLFGCDTCSGLDTFCEIAPPPDLPPVE